MRRYTFLLLAFFLSMSAHADGLGMGSMNISAAPNSLANVDSYQGSRSPSNDGSSSTGIKQTSARNSKELGNIKESTEVADQPASSVPNLNKGTKTSALKNVSCKTYEGKIYDQGDAGYNDCIRTIKTDRQTNTQVP